MFYNCVVSLQQHCRNIERNTLTCVKWVVSSLFSRRGSNDELLLPGRYTFQDSIGVSGLCTELCNDLPVSDKTAGLLPVVSIFLCRLSKSLDMVKFYVCCSDNQMHFFLLRPLNHYSMIFIVINSRKSDCVNPELHLGFSLVQLLFLTLMNKILHCSHMLEGLVVGALESVF